jgi:hypothetical protein
LQKSVPPSVTEVAFDCPHCGAYTTHTWFDVFAEQKSKDMRVPGRLDPEFINKLQTDKELSEETKERFVSYFKKISLGKVIIERNSSGSYLYNHVGNLYLSKCFNCGDIAVWVHERVLFPPSVEGPPPNPDLPQDVLADYKEAATILRLSPRGAAGLLRLAIQTLCLALGERGRSVDDDIAHLVEKGLSPLVQQALDSVRVIGNEAVHPGTMDLKDDVDTAAKLFDLVNIIAEQMISNPKHVKAIYDKLPEKKRKAIEERDGKP